MNDITITKDNGTTHRLVNSDFFDVSGIKCDSIIADTPFETTKAKWDLLLDLPLMWDWISIVKVSERTPVLLFAQTPYDKVLGCSNIRKLKYEWIWEKTAATGHLNAKKMPMKAHENILVFSDEPEEHWNMLVFYDKLPSYIPQKTSGHKPANSYTKHGQDGELYGKTKEGISGGGQTDRYPRSVLKFANDKQKLNLHSTQKPIELLRYFIRTYTNIGDTVLDFTAGSMSLSVACYLEGRNSICIEKDTTQYMKSIQWVKHCSKEYNYCMEE